MTGPVPERGATSAGASDRAGSMLSTWSDRIATLGGPGTDGFAGSTDPPGVRDRYPDRDANTVIDPDELAETYWHLVEQDDLGTQPFEVHVTNGPQNTEFI